MKKPINILLNASIYYVLFRFLIWLVLIFNRNLAETINYHYSDSLFWYFIWFISPILTSILISIKFQIKFQKQIGKILLPILLIGTLIIGYLNNDYWGYWFKRPTVFNELNEASSIISITDINKPFEKDDFSIEIDTDITKELYGIEDLYYGNFDRPIMVFLDNAHVKPDLYYWFEITKDTNKKITKSELSILTKNIQNSNFLIQPESESYTERANRFRGKIIEFKTDNSNFYHIALTSGEVGNDHYPFYEFLINTKDPNKIIKWQIFYTDFAGIEGVEYVNFAVLLEFSALVIIGLIVMIFNGISLIMKKRL